MGGTGAICKPCYNTLVQMVFFCPFCHVQLADLKKGVPHAPVTLSKYNAHDHRQPEEKTFTSRTVDGMAAMADMYATSGLPKGQVSKFQNCEGKPLISAKGPVIDHVSVMPLHLSLGLGLQLIDVTEDIASALDLQIRENNGLSTHEVTDTMENLESLQQQQMKLEEELILLKAAAEQLQQQIADINDEHPEYEAREGAVYRDKSRDAVDVRKQIRELKKQHNQNKNSQKVADKSLANITVQTKRLQTWLEKQRGPFGKKFQAAIDNMNLKRQVYHSGALVGGDINTVFSKKASIDSIGLMAPSRPLCQHEVTILKIRCISMGNWFPVNFPNERLKRKFHVVAYHVHEKAYRARSVGMEAEHISESIHPIVNGLKRRYATVQNLKIQLPLICKGQWLSSNPLNPDYQNKQNCRHCSRCGEPSHYGKTACNKIN